MSKTGTPPRRAGRKSAKARQRAKAHIKWHRQVANGWRAAPYRRGRPRGFPLPW